MNNSVDTAASPSHPRLPFDCNGAAVRAQCRHLATVVTISGVIDAGNVDQVIAYAQRFNLPDNPFILDLSGLDTFSAQAVRLLYAVDEACSAHGLEWALIPSQAVSLTLLVTQRGHQLPHGGPRSTRRCSTSPMPPVPDVVYCCPSSPKARSRRFGADARDAKSVCCYS